MIFPLIAILLIFFIAGGAWFFNKVVGANLCIVCAGVAGTWIVLSLIRLSGYEVNPLIIAILMGGSVVGIMYQIERRRPREYTAPFLKLLFIIAGFASVYTFLQYLWLPFFISAILSILLAYGIYRSGSSKSAEREKSRLKELTEKMKKCC